VRGHAAGHVCICWLDKQLVWNRHPVVVAETDRGVEGAPIQSFAVRQPVLVEFRPTSTGKSTVQLGGDAVRRTTHR